MIRRLAPLAKGGRAAGRALFLAVCALGVATVAQGAWIPVKAAVAQVLLDRESVV